MKNFLGRNCSFSNDSRFSSMGTPVSQGTSKPKPISGWDGSRITMVIISQLRNPQKDDSNGAVKIQGTGPMLAVTTLKIANVWLNN